MPDATWPAGLPTRFLTDGYALTFGDGAQRTGMDSGPPKVRKKFTAAVRPVRATIRLTAAQATLLRNFYEGTCGYGAVPFALTEPITGETARFAFAKPPRVVPRSAVRFEAELELDWLPA
jgi:hypothetical protein